MVFKVDEKLVVVFVCGDYEVNDVKVKNVYGVLVVEFVFYEEVKVLLNCEVGLLGLINVIGDIEIIVDYVVVLIVNGCLGVNEEGFYYVNVNLECDFKVS